MTLPPVIRVFFAVDLSESAKEKLGAFINTLKRKSRTHGIRWSKPENLHITLQFLAETHSEHLPLLIANVRAKIEGIVHSSALTFGSLHLFPSPYRPRVIVLDIMPHDELAMLSRLIGEGITATHYEIEHRPFRAHLTLGRIKQPQDLNLSFLGECEIPEFDKIIFDEVVLFRSEPQPEGSRYTAIEKLHLLKQAG
jgi:2'-5' RNA ligase